MRRRIYDVVKDHSESLGGHIYNIAMSIIIVINVVFILIDTLANEPADLTIASHIVEITSVIIFTVDYVIRLWTANLRYPEMNGLRSRLRFAVTGMALIDLLSILPFYLPFLIPIDLRILRTLRLVRLIRVFKLGRHSDSLSRIGRVLKKTAPALLSSISVILLLMVIASVLEYYVEYPAQPDKFSSAFSGLWWVASTITTVGYGDIYPVTGLGRLIGGVIELLGVGLIAIPTGILSAGFTENSQADPTPEPEGNTIIEHAYESHHYRSLHISQINAIPRHYRARLTTGANLHPTKRPIHHITAQHIRY